MRLSASCIVGFVLGVTQLQDVVYVSVSSSILRFDATTRQRLADIDVKDLKDTHYIVACEQTSRLYVATVDDCVWRMSADGADVKLLLPKSRLKGLKLCSLSVTSTRPLVTLRNACQLIQLDARGGELRRVQLPRYMDPWHAEESPTGTFIVSLYNRDLEQHQVSEVNTNGEVLRQFSGSRLPSPDWLHHIAVDSDGDVFVADFHNRQVLLLDAQLTLRRVIIDDRQLQNFERPQSLCYIERTGELLVGLDYSVKVFSVMLC